MGESEAADMGHDSYVSCSMLAKLRVESRGLRARTGGGDVPTRSTLLFERILLDQLLFLVDGVEIDFAAVFERANDVDDFLLLRFDDAPLGRSEIFHFFAQRFGC